MSAPTSAATPGGARQQSERRLEIMPTLGLLKLAMPAFAACKARRAVGGFA
jgi:hypothetical protein